jgi:peptidoglycan/xylan/chitin deacetylase (PgdA/CDA1 family)
MGKTFNVCLSHDVDRISKTFQFVTHFFKSLFRKELSLAAYQLKSVFQKKQYWGFDKIIELENKLQVKSTFFFLNETYPFNPLNLKSWRLSLGYYDLFSEKVQAVMRKLDSLGWEIGLHGSYCSFENIVLLRKEKLDMESILGHSIMGVRQHYLNLNDKTWEIQAEAGFMYDASFGFTRDIGFKDEKYWAFKPTLNQKFYVVPLSIMDSCLMIKKNYFQEALKLIDLAQEKQACLVLNWHQRTFNEKEFPGYAKAYIQIIEECKKRDSKFMTIGEYICSLSKC